MTLIDSRPGIAATYRALSRATGVPVDADAAVTRLGPPLEQEMARWFPAGQVASAVSTYRSLYPEHAIVPSRPMPGALEALAAVRAAGGRVLVVTAKHPRLAAMHLGHLGIEADELVGLAWLDSKAGALCRAGALAYVGDHVADMEAANRAGVAGIGVTTGPCSARQLADAGASAVLADLTSFPKLLEAVPE